jgi:hypothetical protein
MLCVFDEARPESGAGALMGDLIRSLLRQWLVEEHAWTYAAALLGGFGTLYIGVHLQVPVPRRLRAIPAESPEAFFVVSATVSLLAILVTTIACIAWFRLAKRLRHV